MKSVFTILTTMIAAAAIMMNTATAQIVQAMPSPYCKITQKIGVTEVTLDYSRPGVKDRTVYGDLVPYGKIWRFGANQSTKITFGDDVKLEGQEIPKGTYAFYAIPGETEWTIMVYKDLKLGGYVAKYDKENELTRFTVKSSRLADKVETMNLYIAHARNNSAYLNLDWENTRVSMKVEVNTNEKVEASIEKVLAGPTSNDYYAAARFYYENDKDMDQALEWITKAVDMHDGAFWKATWKARILAKMDKKDDAIKAAKMAIEWAEKAENSDYVKMNKDIIAELQ